MVESSHAIDDEDKPLMEADQAKKPELDDKEPISKRVELDVSDDGAHIIDSLLSQIGFGKYQIRVCIFLSIIVITDGAETILSSFLIACVQREWDLTTGEVNFLSSFVIAGLVAGVFLSGKISEWLGRKNPVIWTTLLMFVAGVLSFFVQTKAQLVISRMIYGFVGGLQFTLIETYLSEIAPKSIRGTVTALCSSIFFLGGLFCCFWAFEFLDSPYEGDWRSLLLWIAVPALIGFVGTLIYLDESPRYLILSRQKTAEGIEIMKKMAKVNGYNVEFEPAHEQKLSRYSTTLNSKSIDFISLFSPRNIKTTLGLWGVWLMITLTYFGMVLILPFIFQRLKTLNPTEPKGSIADIAFPIYFEILASLLASYLVESKYIGRRLTICTALFVSAFTSLLALIKPDFLFWSTFARAMLIISLTALYPFTLDLYPTPVRASGLAYATTIARIGLVVMPWIVFNMVAIGPKLPYLLFMFTAIIGMIFASIIPQETQGKELDQLTEEVYEGKGSNRRLSQDFFSGKDAIKP